MGASHGTLGHLTIPQIHKLLQERENELLNYLVAISNHLDATLRPACNLTDHDTNARLQPKRDMILACCH